MTPRHRYAAGKGHAAVLFASDLHLSPQHPQGLAELRHLVALTEQADALYLLGDIFEHWVGDDDLRLPFNAEVARALRGCRCPVYAMWGNRDFLLGSRFEQATGCTLLSEPTPVDLFGVPTLLLHGDTLCSDDVRYQRFRSVVRKPWVQRAFLLLPHALRTAIAGFTRRKSRAMQSGLPDAMFDATDSAVTALLRQSGAHRLLHGHTHRPALHTLEVDGHARERWVLGDWYGVGSALRVTPAGAETVSLKTT